MLKHAFTSADRTLMVSTCLKHTFTRGWGKGTFSKRTLPQRTFSKGPLAKEPLKSKDLWSKGPLHQRTFPKSTFCQKALLVKGPFGTNSAK